MVYPLTSGILFALLVGQAARAVNPGSALLAALVSGVAMFASLIIPPLLFKYSLTDIAPVVLSRLTLRTAFGAGILLVGMTGSLILSASFGDPEFLGEMYLYTLVGVLLFQAVGELITHHVLYLQHTHQYNSNQLFAMLVGIALLLFILVLYFLAFDLAQPPTLHHYLRDMLAITTVVFGYGRAVYLMAHH